ncbi:MAG: mercuric transporter MerT family protein [Bradymonadaceae bacterium]
MRDESSEHGRGWALIGSIGAAVGAAICCLGPVVLVSLGVTGAWIGGLSALEAYRPYFMGVAAGLLGLAFYRTYGIGGRSVDRSEQCDGEQACEVPAAGRASRVAVWGATIVVAILFASPYVLEARASAPKGEAHVRSPELQVSTRTSKRARVVLEVDGMTCGGCVETVSSVLEDVSGVRRARVTLEPPRATVVFDPTSTDVRELTDATAEVGYESTPRE